MFEMERWWEKLSNIKDSSHTWSRFVRLSWRTCCRLSFGRAERWTWAELWRTWWSPGLTKCRRSEKTLEPDWGSPTVAAHGKNICIFFLFRNTYNNLEIHRKIEILFCWVSTCRSVVSTSRRLWWARCRGWRAGTGSISRQLRLLLQPEELNNLDAVDGNSWETDEWD